MRTQILGLSAIFFVALAIMPGQASSHREAPLTAQDPTADNTDVYAFVSPDEPDKVTLISNFIPFQKADGGPNFFQFDPNVVYEIHIDNNGDAVEDITYQWRFTTEIRNPSTFLYNTGTVTTLDDPDLNVRQFYRLVRIDGPRRTGTVTELSGRLPVPPPNIGPRSTPNYASLGGGVQQLAGNTRVFAGQRDEGFYVDLGIFDLLGVGSGQIEDGTAGFNVSSLAIQVPKSTLARGGTTPVNASDPNAIIGVWSTASRFTTRTLSPGGQVHSGPLVQVSRLGNPLVNEAVIDLARKDAFNGIEPTSDAVAELIVRRVIEGRRQRRGSRGRSQHDVEHVVTRAAAVGEAGDIAAEHAERAGAGRGRNRHVEPQHLGGTDVGGLVESRDAREEDRHQVVARRRRRVHVEDELEQLGHFRIGHAVQGDGVTGGLDAVKGIFARQVDHGLVDQGIAQARHLHQRAAVDLSTR